MLRNHRLKELNSGISNLVKDLEERDMLDDVTIIAWGEFGRTPKINNRAGRDHWPRVMSVLMAGGGMKNGQVIGSTDSHAADPNDRPVYIPEIFATLYHNMGIDVSKVQLPDLAGRPQGGAPGRGPQALRPAAEEEPTAPETPALKTLKQMQLLSPRL